MWVGPGRGVLVNVIRRYRNDGDCTKIKDFDIEKLLDLRNLQLQCVSAKYAQYKSIPATKLGQVKIQLLSKLHAKTFFLTLINKVL